MKRGWLIGAALAVVCVAFGFAAVSEEAATVTDQTGAVVRIEGPVDRIASVYGSGTYYLYTLGAADRLVAGWYLGVKGIAQAPEALFRLEPRLEDLLLFGNPNVEELVSRGVQLVLVDGSRHAEFAAQMGDLGVPVLQFLVETPEALLDAVRLTGESLGAEESARAEAFIADYERVFETVREELAEFSDEDRVRALFLGSSPLSVASGDMYQTDLIEAAGGVSVTGDLFGYWNDVSLEQILLWDPDVILIPPYGSVQAADILGNPDWQSIQAVRDGRVHRMPRLIAAMDAPVPESLLGVVWMAGLFYPNLVSLDRAEEASHFYSTYYGFTLTDEDLAVLTAR